MLALLGIGRKAADKSVAEAKAAAASAAVAEAAAIAAASQAEAERLAADAAAAAAAAAAVSSHTAQHFALGDSQTHSAQHSTTTAATSTAMTSAANSSNAGRRKRSSSVIPPPAGPSQDAVVAPLSAPQFAQALEEVEKGLQAAKQGRTDAAALQLVAARKLRQLLSSNRDRLIEEVLDRNWVPLLMG
jgi:hypothetical protein